MGNGICMGKGKGKGKEDLWMDLKWIVECGVV